MKSQLTLKTTWLIPPLPQAVNLIRPFYFPLFRETRKREEGPPDHSRLTSA